MSQIPADFDFTQLSVPERLDLIGRIWDSIEERNVPELTAAQKAELEQRIDEHERAPDDVVSLDEIRAELRRERNAKTG